MSPKKIGRAGTRKSCAGISSDNVKGCQPFAGFHACLSTLDDDTWQIPARTTAGGFPARVAPAVGAAQQESGGVLREGRSACENKAKPRQGKCPIVVIWRR
jgi:hypothetical protein